MITTGVVLGDAEQRYHWVLGKDRERHHYQYRCKTFEEALVWSYWQHQQQSSFPEQISCSGGRVVDKEELEGLWQKYEGAYKRWELYWFIDERLR